MSNRFEDEKDFVQKMVVAGLDFDGRFAGKQTGYKATFEVDRLGDCPVVVEIVALALDREGKEHQFAYRLHCRGMDAYGVSYWELGSIEDAAAFLAGWQQQAETDRAYRASSTQAKVEQAAG